MCQEETTTAVQGEASSGGLATCWGLQSGRAAERSGTRFYKALKIDTGKNLQPHLHPIPRNILPIHMLTLLIQPISEICLNF